MDMIDDTQIETFCLRYENNVEELQSYWDNIIYYPDKADYALAAAFGLISFLINTLFVGDLSLENASDWGAEKINQFVVFAANKGGYKGENLKEAELLAVFVEETAKTQFVTYMLNSVEDNI